MTISAVGITFAHRTVRLAAAGARNFMTDDSGSAAAEYALIMALVVAGLVGVLTSIISAVAHGILAPANAMNVSGS